MNLNWPYKIKIHWQINMKPVKSLCCMRAQLLSCVRLCDPMNYSPTGSSVHAISQARILEWDSISFSRWSFQPRDQTYASWVSCIARQILYHCACLNTESHFVLPHKRHMENTLDLSFSLSYNTKKIKQQNDRPFFLALISRRSLLLRSLYKGGWKT